MTLAPAERTRRDGIWSELLRRGGPNGVPPSLLKELRIHRGQQGVYRDQENTAHLTPTGAGVAVGVLHTGSTYADDLSDDGVIYHYPATSRGQRDGNEIAAMKTCRELQLPIFVVVTPEPGARLRSVRKGWAVDVDDASGQLLILFTDDPPRWATAVAKAETEPFELRGHRRDGTALARARRGQARFRFVVVKRYGARCAVCAVDTAELLETAHLCPVKDGGSDDPRNGLVLCLNHHRSVDLGLLAIDPITLSVAAPPGLGVTVASLKHLPALPHPDALAWLARRFQAQ